MMLVEVKRERERGMVRTASCCACLGLLSLILAAVLPMFVVTALRAHGKVFLAQMDVDLAIGDGLWKRSVCYGGSKPDEETLARFGLTCKGSLQTAHCGEEGLSKHDEDRCDEYAAMQGLESLAIFATFVAAFIGSLARSCSTKLRFLSCLLRVGTLFSLAMAIACASAVLTLVKESDMVDERTFGCTKMFGAAELCHGYGASYGLQWAAIGELTIALILHVLLLFVSSSATSYEYVRAPLLGTRAADST